MYTKQIDNVHRKGAPMAKANYDLPNDKILEIMRLSGVKSKREALVLAIDAYIERKLIEELINSQGKFKLTWTQKSLRKYRGR